MELSVLCKVLGAIWAVFVKLMQLFLTQCLYVIQMLDGKCRY